MRIFGLLLIFILFAACTTKSIKKDAGVSDSKFSANAYIINETVNMRSGNSLNSQIIDKLNDGQPVQIIRNVNGWYEIFDDERNKGWVRSDMVGPKELSRTLSAAAFVDSILPGFNSEMYFDKTDLYKTIYVILPDSYYTSKNKAQIYATEIGKDYQKFVYPGHLEIRVMEKNRENLYLRIQLKSIGDGNMPVPIINKGRLVSIDENNWQIKMNIAVPVDITDAELLEQARSISSVYELPYSKIEIFQIADNDDGRTYLSDHNIKPKNSSICKLYYLEDKDGEYHKFNYCK